MSAEAAIYAKLSGTAGITALVGSGNDCRVYPNQALAGCALPYIVFKQDNTSQVNDTKDGASVTDEQDYILLIVGATFTAARQLSELVRTTLDQAEGVMGGITVQVIDFRNENADYMDGILTHGAQTITQSYTVRYNR